MKTILKTALTAFIILGMSATVASADHEKGKRLFQKKIKKSCGNITGAALAGKHTQAEWEEINEDGGIADEIKSICPKVPSNAIKEKFIPHYFDFFYEYGSDSGNVPSC